MNPEFENDAKWHFFVFEVDENLFARLREELRVALVWNDPSGLKTFLHRHTDPYEQALLSITMDVGRETFSSSLKKAEQLLHHPDTTTIRDTIETPSVFRKLVKKEKEEAIEVYRKRWEDLVNCIHLLDQYRTYNAPGSLVISSTNELSRQLGLEVSESDSKDHEYAVHCEYSLSELFDDCLTICAGPFPVDRGLCGDYEVLCDPIGSMLENSEDPFWPRHLMLPAPLIDPRLPIHYELFVKERQLVTSDRRGPIAWCKGDQLLAHADRLGKLDLHITARDYDDGQVVLSPQERKDRAKNRFDHYISTCRHAAETAKTLISFVGKNPAL